MRSAALAENFSFDATPPFTLARDPLSLATIGNRDAVEVPRHPSDLWNR